MRKFYMIKKEKSKLELVNKQIKNIKSNSKKLPCTIYGSCTSGGGQCC